MAFQFPANPTVGQSFTPSAGLTFKWNGTAWYLVNSTLLTPAEADTRYVQIANARSMESRIINGNFAIDQRNAGAVATVTSSNAPYGPDRWRGTLAGTATGQFTIKREPAGPNQYALRAQTTIVDATIDASDFYMVGHTVEGVNIADLEWGAASAKPVTFAARMFAVVPGTYSMVFRNSAETIGYVKTFTVPAAWTDISFTIPGPTSGVWQSGTAGGLQIWIGLGVGSNQHAPAANSWQSGSFLGVAGCVNMLATLNASFWIVDARLYPGSIDYGPCQRLYADELRLCQRYYAKSYSIDTVPGTATSAGVRATFTVSTAVNQNYIDVDLPTPMRALPAVTLYSPRDGATGMFDIGSANLPAIPFHNSDNHFLITNNGAVPANVQMLGHWTASAEL